MGVKVREKPKGSGVYWVFINHQGRRKSKRIGTDEGIALDVAEKIKAKLVLGELDVEKIKPSAPKFKQVAQMWLKQPHDWKESTREGYQLNFNKHVFPAFKSVPVDKITRKSLKNFFNKLYASGLNVNTIRLVRAPFSGVLSYAVELEQINSNPMRDVELKYKKKKFEIEPLNEIESQKVLDEAKIFQAGKYYPPMLCALRTGMRIGEIIALQWRDLDFDKRSIEVRRSYRKGRMTDTKNKKRRRVDMTPHLSETLKSHKTAQKRRALKAGKRFSEFVFTGTRNEMLNRVVFQNALNRCTENAKLRKIRTHDLRHSYATIRLMRGHNVGDVSYQLGHSSIKITYDVYAHWIPGQFKSEVDELDQMHPSAPQAHPENGAL